jgi:hypothetical protein
MLNTKDVDFEEMIKFIRDNIAKDSWSVHPYVSMYLMNNFDEILFDDVRKCIDILRGMDLLTKDNQLV